ncbi:MAG TPA: 30S ribosomal protein S21 [Gemmataceae bacterium]|nr:30S ribosomal protein S21 [Gemmataceae bacterium]
MGVRIRLHDGEPIRQTLRLFKQLLARAGMVWELQRHVHVADPTQVRRARRFQKRFKSRQATLLAQKAGDQPVQSLADATEAFWKRTGKP